MRPVFICGVSRSGTNLLLSLLSGHSRLCVPGIDDGLISGLADAGPEFEQALASRSLGKLYRLLCYRSEFTEFRLLAYAGSRNFSKNRQAYKATLPFVFDVDTFENGLIDRITEEDRQTRYGHIPLRWPFAAAGRTAPPRRGE